MKFKTFACLLTLAVALCAAQSWALDTPQLREAYEAFTQGDYAKAVNLWEDSLLNAKMDDADKGQINLNMALAYTRLGKPELAKRHLDISLRFDPNNVETYVARGDLMAMQGNLGQAIVEYGNALTLNSRYYGAYLNRAIAYSKYNNLTAALADFSKALELGAPLPQVYNSRGNAYEAAGDLDKAMQQFTRCIELKPDYPSPYFNRSRIFERQGKLKEAMADAEKFAQLAHGHPYAAMRIEQLKQKMSTKP